MVLFILSPTGHLGTSKFDYCIKATMNICGGVVSIESFSLKESIDLDRDASDLS